MEEDFPSRKEIKEVLKRLEKVKGSYILPPDASEVDQAKYELCKLILNYKMNKNLTQKDLAEKMKLPVPRVCEVLHYRIELFTIDRLFEYYQKLKPNAKLHVA